MMQQPKSMILRLGSQVMMIIGSWFHAQIAQIINQGILRFGAVLRRKM